MLQAPDVDAGPGESQVKARQHSALDWPLPSLGALFPEALSPSPRPPPSPLPTAHPGEEMDLQVC